VWFNGTYLQPWDNAAGTGANFTGAPGTVTVAVPITVQNITFSTDGYTIEGSNPLTFSGAASTITTSGGTDTIETVLAGTGSLTKAGAGTLVLTGTNAYTGGTILNAGVLSIASDANLGESGGNLTFSGGTLLTRAGVDTARSIVLPGNGTINNAGSADIFSGAISGVGSLTFTGAGTTTLSGINGYTGGTTISGGTVQISRDANLSGVAVPLTINGGTLATTDTFTTTRPITLGTGGARFDVANTTTFTIGSVLSPSGLGSAATPIPKIGAGTLSLSAGNNFAGAIAINAGTLEFSPPSGVGSQYSGVISGDGAILKSGAGTVTLDGANTYAGGTTVSAGTLAVQSGASLGLSTVPLNLTGGTLTNRAFGPAVTLFNPVILTGTPIISGASFTLEGPISGTGTLQAIGLGASLTLTNTANSYEGGTLIQGSTLSISSDAELGAPAGMLTLGPFGGTLVTTANITSDRNITVSAGGVNVAPDTTLNLTGVITGFGSTKAGAGTLELSGPNTGMAGTGFNGTISITGGTVAFNPAIGTTVTYPGAIDNVGAVAQIGAGTTILSSNTNSWLGGTTISAGTLQIGNGINSGAISGTGAIAMANNAALVFNTPTALGLSGNISGSGSLTKTCISPALVLCAPAAAGTLTLSGTNTYTGPTAVNAGALFVNGNSSGATGLVTVASGARLGGSGSIGGSVTMASSSTLIPAPAVIPPPVGTSVVAGTLTIGGNLTLAGGTTLNYALGGVNATPTPIADSLVDVRGNLTLEGATSLNIVETTGGSFSPGVYRLFNYGGALMGAGSITVASAPAPLSFLDVVAGSGQINLDYREPTFPMTFWNGGDTTLHGNGHINGNGGDGVWQGPVGNTNWTDSAGLAIQRWSDNGFAVFAGTAGAVTVNNTIGGAINFTGAQFMTSGYWSPAIRSTSS
jgi:autotransporter-associated beta strand protein